MSEREIPWDMYANTRVRIFHDGREIVVMPSAEQHHPLPDTWHVITAWNPDSVLLDDSLNRERNERLRAHLHSAGHVAVDAEGVAVDGSHPPEPSFAVTAMSTTEAVAVGLEFGQAAVFCIDVEGLHVVDCRTGETSSSSGYVVGEK